VVKVRTNILCVRRTAVAPSYNHQVAGLCGVAQTWARAAEEIGVSRVTRIEKKMKGHAWPEQTQDCV
jgi:hypothetical protein